MHWFNLVCLSVDEFGGLIRWGIVHGAGKTMSMRGGACAAELRLMGVCFFLGLVDASEMLLVAY